MNAFRSPEWGFPLVRWVDPEYIERAYAGSDFRTIRGGIGPIGRHRTPDRRGVDGSAPATRGGAHTEAGVTMTTTRWMHKILVCTASVLLTAPWAHAQICFSDRILDELTDAPVTVHAADIDGDGDLDIVSGSLFDDVIHWFENDGAADPSFTRHTLASAIDRVRSVVAADLDADGDTDVLSASIDDNSVRWYENDGNETFAVRLIDGALTGTRIVRTRDMDADGDLDILSASFDDAEVYWYESDLTDTPPGTPPAFTRRLVTNAAPGSWAAEPADIDGDTMPDIIAGCCDDGTLAWYRNDGASPPAFTLAGTVNAGIEGLRFVSASDVNADGATDVITASDGDDAIRVHLSNGAADPTFTELVLTQSATLATSVFPADLDGDSDTDILYTSRGDNTVGWFESNGAPIPSFTERLVTTGAPGAQSVVAADIDSDGDIDAATAEGNIDRVVWYEHARVLNADTLATFATLADAIDAASDAQTLLAELGHFDADCAPILDFSGVALRIESEGDIARPAPTSTLLAQGATLAAALGHDIAISGRLEVPGGATAALRADSAVVSGPILLGAGAVLDASGGIEILGVPSFTTFFVSDSVDVPVSVAIGDLDGDGADDVVSASRDAGQILWHRSSGDPTPEFKQSVLSDAQAEPLSVALDDLNGDTLPDVVAASRDDNTVSWYPNSGAEPFFGAPVTISATALGARAVALADMEPDGDVDVISVSGSSDEIRWHINEGGEAPTFSTSVLVNDAFDARTVAIGDLDGDGDADILNASGGDDAIVWYRNDGAGSAPFASFVIDAAASNAQDVAIADLDKDGDLDIAAASRDDNTVAWYQNNGQPSPMFTKRIITQDALFASAVAIGDLNDDGAIDIVSAAFLDDTIRAHLSDGAETPNFTTNVLSNTVDAANRVALGDLDDDGNLDVVTSSFSGNNITWHQSVFSRGVEFDTPATIHAQATLRVSNKTVRLGSGAALSSDTEILIDGSSEVSGVGALDAPGIHSWGVVRPDPGGALTILGDYAQSYLDPILGTFTGQLSISLSAPAALEVSGSATLAGALVVTADPGFDPPVGAEFVILTAGSPIGAERFDVALLPGLPGAKFLRPVYDAPPAPSPIGSAGGGNVVLVVDEFDETTLTDPSSFDPAGVPSGATLGDLDNDGFDDLALVIPDQNDPESNPGQLVILINEQSTQPAGAWPGFSQSTIVLSTGPAPTDVAIGDLDQQSGADLAVTLGVSGIVETYLNAGAPSFTPGPASFFGESLLALEIGDLDNDGLADVAASGGASGSPGQVGVRLNLGTTGALWNGLEPALRPFVVGSVPRDLIAIDLDGDTDRDVVTANFGSDSVSILENRAATTRGGWPGFGVATDIGVGGGPVDVLARDLDEEKDLDLVTVNRTSGSVSVLQQNGFGAARLGSLGSAFGAASEFPVGTTPSSGAFWDIDADGDADPAIIVTDPQTGSRVVRLLRNLSVENANAGTPSLSFVFDEDVARDLQPLLVRSGNLDAAPGLDLAIVTNQPDPFGRGLTAPSGLVYTTPPAPCAADIDADGALTGDDASLFVSLFLGDDPRADLDNDGAIAFPDVGAFLRAFNAGCP